MCYSDKLDQAAGYQEEHGYVLVGYKAVFNPPTPHVLLPIYPCFPDREERKDLIKYFAPHELIEDTSHGMHVAATNISACKALNSLLGTLRVTRTPDGGLIIELPKGTAICRVLVPESAVFDGNHVRALVMIPPTERETEADIKLCDDWNRRHRPVEDLCSLVTIK